MGGWEERVNKQSQLKLKKAILTGIVGLIVGAIGGVLYVDHIARLLVISPPVNFAIVEGIYTGVTLTPGQAAVSQAIPLDKGDRLKVNLFTNHWQETSFGLRITTPPEPLPGREGEVRLPVGFIGKVNAKITVTQLYPGKYEVWLSYRVEGVEDAGMYHSISE